MARAVKSDLVTFSEMRTATIAATLQSAIIHHQAGRLPQAEALYRDVLAQDADCADALHLIGVIALQAGRNEIAVDLIGRAVGTFANERRLSFESRFGLPPSVTSRGGGCKF